MGESRVIANASHPGADAVLEMLDTAAATGTVCSFLTPSIKARLKELEPGQVLLVRVDDPSACLDVPAWCNLTENILQATSEESGVFSFFIKKQNVKQEAKGNG